jgi:oligoribonuclease NrnB/cAMP/cGMP phosphodiesterase (DHH superfamily)
MQYSQPPPVVEGREVYLVDFAFPLEAMRALKAQASRLTWCDHHQSAEPVWRTLGWGVFDVQECGTSLTWRTLFPAQPEPPVVAYIRDKDLWRWQLPHSRDIAAGLSDQFSNSRYQGLLEVDLTAMAARGRPLVEARRQRLMEAAKVGRPVVDALGVVGLRALAVNTPKDQNELGEYICQSQEEGGLGYDLAIIFYRKQDGSWVHSLRSRDGSVDCATIAGRFGGGGHPASACFLSPLPVVAD